MSPSPHLKTETDSVAETLCFNVRSDVFTSITGITVLLDMTTPCDSYKIRRFGGIHRFHLQGETPNPLGLLPGCILFRIPDDSHNPQQQAILKQDTGFVIQ
jgi:hypothetical protein